MYLQERQRKYLSLSPWDKATLSMVSGLRGGRPEVFSPVPTLGTLLLGLAPAGGQSPSLLPRAGVQTMPKPRWGSV